MGNNKLLFIARHGETDWNKEYRWQGSSDIPLNKTGMDQAHQLAKRLQKFNPEIVFSSHLQRAHQTAAVVAKKFNLKHEVDERLREIHVGDAEGLTTEEVQDRWGLEQIEIWKSMDPQHLHEGLPGGESKFSVRERTLEALEEIAQSTPHNKIAIVSHGMVIRTLVHHLVENLTEPVPTVNGEFYQFLWLSQEQQLQFSLENHPEIQSLLP